MWTLLSWEDKKRERKYLSVIGRGEYKKTSKIIKKILLKKLIKQDLCPIFLYKIKLKYHPQLNNSSIFLLIYVMSSRMSTCTNIYLIWEWEVVEKSVK